MLAKGSLVIRQLAGLQPSPLQNPSESVLAWATEEMRNGSLAKRVHEFLAAQPEICDPNGIVVESVTPEWVNCSVVAVAEDREAKSPFSTEFHFRVQPSKSLVERLD